MAHERRKVPLLVTFHPAILGQVVGSPFFYQLPADFGVLARQVKFLFYDSKLTTLDALVSTTAIAVKIAAVRLIAPDCCANVLNATVQSSCASSGSTGPIPSGRSGYSARYDGAWADTHEFLSRHLCAPETTHCLFVIN